MTMTASPNALYRLRRWATAPLVAAVTAGAMCAGIGVGSAAETGSLASPQTSYSWGVKDATTDAVWGEMHKEIAGGGVSELSWTKNSPLASGATATTSQIMQSFSRHYTWGRICFRGSWWNLPRDEHPESDVIEVYAKSPDVLGMRVNRAGPAASTNDSNASYIDLPLIQTPSDSGC